MSSFSHIVFDLDGTLTDNTQGIKNSLVYALNQMQIKDYDENILSQFIGPPLQWGFQNLFGLSRQHSDLAVEYFREYYGENGWHQNIPYEGVGEMLAELAGQGMKMYIATSKLEKYAIRIMEYFEFDKYIIHLKGADYGGEKATKSQILAHLMENQRIPASEEVAMVGDTAFDIDGGKENGLSTVAVTYGFGKKEDLRNSNPDYLVHDVDELFELLAG